jgi:hypothetical protein
MQPDPVKREVGWPLLTREFSDLVVEGVPAFGERRGPL